MGAALGQDVEEELCAAHGGEEGGNRGGEQWREEGRGIRGKHKGE